MWPKSSPRLRGALFCSLLARVVCAAPEATPAPDASAVSEPLLPPEPRGDPGTEPASATDGPDSATEPPPPEPPPSATEHSQGQPPAPDHEPPPSVVEAERPTSRLESPPAPRPHPPREESSKPRTHDGFYARFGTGFGSYDERFQSETREQYGGRVSAQVRGISGASEVAIGWTPYEGFVVGGGVYSADVLTSTLLVNGDRTLPKGFDATSRDFSMVAVFLDRYFVPTLGVHFQAGLGPASQQGVSVGGADFGKKAQIANGVGLMLGFGYENWILDEWSLGVLARASFGVLFSRDKDADARWVHYVVSLPEFLMTVTYH